MICEHDHIVLAFTKRRNVHGDRIDTIQQILSKAAFSDEDVDVLVGRSHKTDVRLEGPGAADRSIFASIQKPEKTDLHLGWHLSQFIKKEGASFRRRDQAGLCTDGAGERALFMTEQFALEEFAVHRSAIDGKKWPPRSAAQIMK